MFLNKRRRRRRADQVSKIEEQEIKRWIKLSTIWIKEREAVVEENNISIDRLKRMIINHSKQVSLLTEENKIEQEGIDDIKEALKPYLKKDGGRKT